MLDPADAGDVGSVAMKWALVLTGHRRALGLALLLGLLVRLPFWVEALRTPVDGDTAIVGLMARHPLGSATLWGQPYGSPLDAWVAAPFVVVFGSRGASLRFASFVLGLGLVAVAYALGARLHANAALPAALVMACPSPYFVLLAALPPPLYATTLVLCGVLLLHAVRLGERLGAGEAPRLPLVVFGVLAGLAFWTHLMAASVIAACAGFLIWRTRRRVRDLRTALIGSRPVLIAFFAASAPWWWVVLRDWRWGTHIVATSNRDQGVLDHLGEVLPALHRPLLGLLGAHVPVIADDPVHVLHAPVWVGIALAVLYGGGLAVAVWRSRLRGAPGMLLLTVLLTILVFPFPLRSGEHTIRYLTAAYLPIVVLVTWALVDAIAERSPRTTWVVVGTLVSLHLFGSARLFLAWRSADRTAAPFLLADLDPVRRLLEEQRVRHAYASYEMAYRLTFASGERTLVTEPWNERFRHYPLPYLDEARFAKNVAWILASPPAGDLPTPQAFEDALNALGGQWKKTAAGSFVVFHGFSPPYGPTVEPLTEAGAAGDGDLATRVVPDTVTPFTIALSSPRTLDGLTLVAGPKDPTLPRSMDVAVSSDGQSFETVARRRRREERNDLRWANGHPQYILDHRMLAIPLGGRRVAAIRISPYLSTESWALAEVLVHPEEQPFRRIPWDEWLDPRLSWAARREALSANPRRDREDWYLRRLVAETHR